jgi:Activator of Hsp90 ATPase homolog 1-like protein
VTKRSAQHGTIRLERSYRASPHRVFAAWAEPKARAKWDVPGRWVIAVQTFDFREGGRELKRFGPKDDPHLAADTLYGRHLLLTEQIVLLDGQDNAANREEGLASMLDKIGETLSG